MVGNGVPGWYVKSANGQEKRSAFLILKGWSRGLHHGLCWGAWVSETSEKIQIPGLVGEKTNGFEPRIHQFSWSSKCFSAASLCHIGSAKYDWSLQLSKLAWKPNFSSCCLFSKFSRCRMKKKMMVIIVMMGMMMAVMTLMTLMTTTTMRDADKKGWGGSVMKGTTPWSSSSGHVRRLRLVDGVEPPWSRLVGTWNSWCNLNAILGEEDPTWWTIMWPDFPEHGSSMNSPWISL